MCNDLNQVQSTILLFTLFDLDLDDVVRVALWLKLSLPGGKNISGSMLFTYITEFNFKVKCVPPFPIREQR